MYHAIKNLLVNIYATYAKEKKNSLVYRYATHKELAGTRHKELPGKQVCHINRGKFQGLMRWFELSFFLTTSKHFSMWPVCFRLCRLHKNPGGGLLPPKKNMTKISANFPTLFVAWPKIDTTVMTLVHSCRKHKFVKGFCCWLYQACVAGVKRGRGRQSSDGRRRAWRRRSFFWKKRIEH